MEAPFEQPLFLLLAHKLLRLFLQRTQRRQLVCLRPPPQLFQLQVERVLVWCFYLFQLQVEWVLVGV